MSGVCLCVMYWVNHQQTYHVQCAVLYTGIWDSFEIYKCDLEGRAQQPTGRAVRGLHSEEVEERYATVLCCFWGSLCEVYINNVFATFRPHCKAHAKINRKMGNSTPCKIVTPKNFNLKLCIRDYVGEATHHANFGSNRYSGGFSPYWRNITTLWLFCLTVLSCLFFSGTRPGRTAEPIFTIYGSNDMFPHKEVPFGG